MQITELLSVSDNEVNKWKLPGHHKPVDDQLLQLVSFSNKSRDSSWYCLYDCKKSIAAGANAIILSTVDGGATWTQQISGVAVEFYGISFTDANNGTVVGGDGTGPGIIVRTINGGANLDSTN